MAEFLLTHPEASTPVTFDHVGSKIDLEATGFDGRELHELLAHEDGDPKK
jgi:hypothetical protein